MKKQYYKSATSKSPLSGAVLAGDTLYISGQLGIDPATGIMQEGTAAQAEQAMRNLKNQLAQADMTFDDVVKTLIFVRDTADVAAVNQAYAAYFGEDKPARSLVKVEFPNPKALVEIEAVAVR